MDIGIAWIDLASLHDCVRLHGGSQLIASWSFNFANYHANQDLLYMCKAEKWLRGRNAFSHAFPHAFLPCFPCFPSYTISCYLFARILGNKFASLRETFLHGALPREPGACCMLHAYKDSSFC